MATARGAQLDPSASERAVPGLIDALAQAPSTRAVVVCGDRLLVEADAVARVHVPLVPAGAVWAFLGRDEHGSAVLVAALPDDAAADPMASLREIGSRLNEADLAIALTAVALGRWLTGYGFCPRCGAEAMLTSAGWSRRCVPCGTELFPRTDPAVIVAIQDEQGERLLLGANAAWQGRMFSCFAGFVEAGESLETAIHREIEEESGVRVHALEYLGSQPWPYPQSIMLGFLATVVDADEVQPDGEEIVDARWFTREEATRALAGDGDVGFPSSVSIAHRLIRAWVDRA
ncbi:MAG: NAD(+) diphosphatase [Microbacterium sp.]